MLHHNMTSLWVSKSPLLNCYEKNPQAETYRNVHVAVFPLIFKDGKKTSWRGNTETESHTKLRWKRLSYAAKYYLWRWQIPRMKKTNPNHSMTLKTPETLKKAYKNSTLLQKIWKEVNLQYIGGGGYLKTPW